MAPRDEIKKIATELAAMDAEQWAMRPELGLLTFADVIPEIANMRRVATILSTANLDIFPNGVQQNTLRLLREAAQHLNAIRSFNINQGNPVDSRNNIKNQVRNAYDQLYGNTQPVVAMLLSSDTAASSTSDFETKMRELLERATAFTEKQKELAEEAGATLASIKKAAGEAGVSQEAVHFAAEATEHKRAAVYWAAATVAVAAATLVWGALVVWLIPIDPDAKAPEIVQHALGKILVFTALYYALIWCGRNYRANRHNYVMNKHRQNSLSTFESFVRAAQQDVGIKNAVLLQATTAIFAAHSTGYAASDGDQDPPNKVIEIMRSVSDKPVSS